MYQFIKIISGEEEMGNKWKEYLKDFLKRDNKGTFLRFLGKGRV